MTIAPTLVPSGRVVVTGAGGAIGSAIVDDLVARGYEVLATDVARPERDDVQTLAADITTERGRAPLLDALTDAIGLVNGAGINLSAPLAEINDEMWDRTIDVNVKAMFHLTRAAGERLADGGSIVNIASTSANLARFPASTAYAASKAAVVNLSKSLARAFAPRIRVNSICPGLIATPMQTRLMEKVSDDTGRPFDEVVRSAAVGVALARLGEPAEVARAISFLLGPEASYVTGVSLDVDGGLSMR